MKKKIRLLISFFKLVAALLLVLAIGADLYGEIYGLPDSLAHRVVDSLSARGISCDVSVIRAGFVRGIHCRDVRVSTRFGGWHIALAAGEFSLRPSWASLFTGDLQVTSVSFSEGKLSLVPVGTEGDSEPLHFDSLQGRIRSGDDLAYRIELKGHAYGIHLAAIGTVNGLTCFPMVPRDKTPEPVPDNGKTPSDASDAWVEHWVSLIQRCVLSENAAAVNLEFDTDLQNPTHTTLSGRFEVGELLVGRTMLHRSTGVFNYAEQRLRIQHFAAMVNDEELVRGEGMYDFARKQISGTVSGRIAPVTISRLFDYPRATAVERWGLLHPLAVTVLLHPSPLSLEQLHGEITLEGEDLAIRGLPVAALYCQGTLEHHMLSVSSFQVSFPSHGMKEEIKGAFTWWLGESALAGQLNGRVMLPMRLRQAGVQLPSLLTGFDVEGEPVALSATLERGPLDWRKWRLRGSVDARDLSYRDWQATRVQADLSLVDSVFSATHLCLSFPDMPSEAISGEVKADFSQMASVDKVELSAQIKGVIQTRNAEGIEELGKWEKGIDLTVQATIHPVLGTVTGTLRGTAYPLRAYKAFRNALHLPDNWALYHLSCGKSPATIELSLAECRWESSKRELTGKASVPEFIYNGVSVLDVSTGITVTETEARFTRLQARDSRGPAFVLDLALLYQPFAVNINDAEWLGDPACAEVFIEAPVARDLYLAIWRHLQWSETTPPKVVLKRLSYQSGGRGSDWSLDIDSSLVAGNARFRELPLEQISANVNVALPGRVSISDIIVQTDTATARGQVDLQTELPRLCEFHMEKLKGGCDPKVILHNINPEWDRFLESFAFSEEASFSCGGSFFLGQEPNLNISGHVVSPFCIFENLRFENVDMQWGVRDSVIYWDVGQSTLYGGDVCLTGTYDTRSASGALACKVEKSSLWSLLNTLCGNVKYEDIGAQLSGNCRLFFFRNWAGHNLQLSGNGRVQIGGADLWRIPVLGDLGELLNKSLLNKLARGWLSSIGSITQLDALLDFKGTYVVVPRLETDGTVLALKGDGEYLWDSDRIRFNVAGETLKNIGVLNFALRPLSWVFNAELEGTLTDHRWHLINSLRKAIGGGTDTFEGGDM